MDDERAVSATTVLVNGRRREVRTEQDTALLYVLRNHLGLKGTRFGCGLGSCGARKSPRSKGWEPRTSRIR